MSRDRHDNGTPVLARSISRDTGWSVPTITAAFSLGLIISALVGIPAGRWLDRRGPRWLMTGWLALAPTMLATALAPWAGAALAGVLGGYPALFCLLAVVAGVAAGLIVGSVRPRPTGRVRTRLRVERTGVRLPGPAWAGR
jgi:MFS family permease